MGKYQCKPEKIFLKEKVDYIFEMNETRAHKKNIRTVNDIDNNILVYTDESTLISVLQNLITNSIKFSSENGKVVVEAKCFRDYIEISIIDEGVRIPDDIKDKIFDGKEHITTRGTVNEKGTGLGLKICKEMIEFNEG